MAAATEQPTPADTPEPAPDWTQTASLVDELYVLGNPNAAIRAIDYDAGIRLRPSFDLNGQIIQGAIPTTLLPNCLNESWPNKPGELPLSQ